MRCTSRYVWNCMDIVSGMKNCDFDRNIETNNLAHKVEIYHYFQDNFSVKASLYKVNGDRTMIDRVNQGVYGEQDH